MKKDEAKLVLDALEGAENGILSHHGVVITELMAAIEIMRREVERPEISDAEIEIIAIEGGIYDCITDPYDKFKTGDDYGSVMHDLKRFARALLKKAR